MWLMMLIRHKTSLIKKINRVVYAVNVDWQYKWSS